MVIEAGLVAYEGEAELLNATWNLDSGRLVELRVVEKPGASPVHPFRTFQKRRGGRMGQRFHLACVEVGQETPMYDSEVMFCAWSDSDRGHTIKLWIDEDGSSIHQFAGYRKRSGKEVGTLFAVVFVVLNDEGGAVDLEAEAAVNGHRRKVSSDVHLMVTSQLFIQYLTERCGHTQVLERKGLSWTPDLAKQYVKTRLGIESLSDLDRDEAALKRFHEEIRKPYLKFTGREA